MFFVINSLHLYFRWVKNQHHGSLVRCLFWYDIVPGKLTQKMRATWVHFNIKTLFPCMDSHCKENIAMRLSYLYNGHPYTGKKASLCWSWPQSDKTQVSPGTDQRQGHSHPIQWKHPSMPLTHLPLDKMAAILADDNFKCNFLNENYKISIWISLKGVQLTMIQHWFAEEATSHYLNQCRPSSLMHICGTRGRWLNVSQCWLRHSLWRCHLIKLLQLMLKISDQQMQSSGIVIHGWELESFGCLQSCWWVL